MSVPAQISTLLPLAKPYLPGCPENLIVREIRRAAREFCEKSKGWVVTLEDLSEEDEATYDLDALVTALGVDATVLEVFRVTVNGARLWPSQYTIDVDHNLVFENAPSADDWEMEILVCLLPNMTWSTLTASLVTRYGEAIVDGALWRLQSMSNRPWSDPQCSRDHNKSFYNGVGKARRERTAGRKGSTIATPA